MDTFFGQAPQLAEILRTIIRYNLLTILFGPTKALCFLGGGGGEGGGVFFFSLRGLFQSGGFLGWKGLCVVTAAVLQ